MAKKTKRRSLKGRKTSRKAPRRAMGSVTCSRVGGKTVCKPSFAGLGGRKRKSSKRKGGLAGGKRVKGTLKGLGSVTCARTNYGYSCRKA